MVQIFTAMAYANSAINPLLYTFLGHNFKERLEESVKNFKRNIATFTAIKKVSGFSFVGCKRVRKILNAYAFTYKHKGKYKSKTIFSTNTFVYYYRSSTILLVIRKS